MAELITSAFADKKKAASPYDIYSSLQGSSGVPAVNTKYKTPDYQSMYTEFNPAQIDALKEGKQIGLDGTISTVADTGAGTPWYQDGDVMQGYAGLASSFAQLAALPGQLKLAKLQRKSLQQNLDQAKTDSAFRATTRANLNAPITGTGG